MHDPLSLDYSGSCAYIFTVAANVSDPSGVKAVNLIYRYHSADVRLKAGPWRTRPLAQLEAGLFRTRVDISQKTEAPTDMVFFFQKRAVYTNGTVDYYLSATNAEGNRADSKTVAVSLTHDKCVIPLH